MNTEKRNWSYPQVDLIIYTVGLGFIVFHFGISAESAFILAGSLSVVALSLAMKEIRKLNERLESLERKE
jgi:ABC-type proline/glycine betaine transport system permease subunit